MADKSKTIIIKRVKKGHGQHHGGSWKVAYSDFMTAMMAFFLLLWLISMVDPVKKAALANYFRNFNLFQQSGQSFMEQGVSIQPEVKVSMIEPVTGEQTASNLKEKLKQAIEEKLKSLKDHIVIDTVEGGIRIQIVDTEGASMFASGSAVLNDKGKEILRVIAENIKDDPYKIAVEGHTDAAPFKGAQRTNWELSTERASAARREIENNGIDPGRIARVIGYADTELLNKEDPKDPRNRRISLIMIMSKERPTTSIMQPIAPAIPAAPGNAQLQQPAPQPSETVQPAQTPATGKLLNDKKKSDNIIDHSIDFRPKRPIQPIPDVR